MSAPDAAESVEGDEIATPTTWRFRLAKVITEIFAPWALAMALFLAVGWRSGPTGLAWGLLGAAITVIGPMAVIIGGVVAGRYTDHHLTTREHRVIPLLISAVLIVIGIGVLQVVGAPSDVVAVQAAMLGVLFVMGPITALWKISFHTGIAGAAVAILSLVWGPGMLGLAVIVVLIGWSRTTLTHHSVLQVMAGPPVAIFATTVPFLLVR
ncbi:hypothetical protein [Actinomadura rugatobispora]|uniref:Phosphoesterase PA-phosphatase n=1 Tax=Actinomadura rugatobispora TaxID=1994 RepID=A0ABW1AAA1_9ACTN|nr:hypothetical protein GCM10010200_082430 [Actinomadura rugatobispora]